VEGQVLLGRFGDWKMEVREFESEGGGE